MATFAKTFPFYNFVLPQKGRLLVPNFSPFSQSLLWRALKFIQSPSPVDDHDAWWRSFLFSLPPVSIVMSGVAQRGLEGNAVWAGQTGPFVP
jgi:hypothetical protein